nr:hypothetical protein [Mycobacterium tuberculosis]
MIIAELPSVKPIAAAAQPEYEFSIRNYQLNITAGLGRFVFHQSGNHNDSGQKKCDGATNRLLDLRFNSSTGSLLTLFLAVEREFELTCTPEKINRDVFEALLWLAWLVPRPGRIQKPEFYHWAALQK